MAKNGQPEGDRVEIEIGDEGREIAAGKDITQVIGDGNVIGNGSSSRVAKMDKRSGGVNFDGEGPVDIRGDVVGGNQTKTTHETHFHGPVTGPIHTGSGDIHIGSMQVGADASLETLLTALRRAVADKAPAGLQSKALQRVDLLAEAITEPEPDLGLMESVVSWFQNRLPTLGGAVIALIFHPAVMQTVEVAGEATLAEFQRRFGRLNQSRGVNE